MKNNKEEKMILISDKRLNELLEKEVWLYCLEAAGIDNWEGYVFAQDMMEGEEEDEN